jgi:hypothetical protein
MQNDNELVLKSAVNIKIEKFKYSPQQEFEIEPQNDLLKQEGFLPNYDLEQIEVNKHTDV